MMYIEVVNGQIVGSPKPLPLTLRFFTEEQKNQAGWYKVENAGVSSFDDENEIIESETFRLEGNKVIRTVTKRQKTAQEIIAHKEKFWDLIRHQRNVFLAESDWVVLKAACQGNPVPEEWAAYRQALRDITAQADPKNVQWPTKP